MAKAEEKRKNCLACNKSLKRVKWFYRNGGYFCGKGCFKEYLKKKKSA
jgi:hypothetical protein